MLPERESSDTMMRLPRRKQKVGRSSSSGSLQGSILFYWQGDRIGPGCLTYGSSGKQYRCEWVKDGELMSKHSIRPLECHYDAKNCQESQEC